MKGKRKIDGIDQIHKPSNFKKIKEKFHKLTKMKGKKED